LITDARNSPDSHGPLFTANIGQSPEFLFHPPTNTSAQPVFRQHRRGRAWTVDWPVGPLAPQRPHVAHGWRLGANRWIARTFRPSSSFRAA
jgi:hypothetical protein